MKHITAYSEKEAWNIANNIFPTDYALDDRASNNAGYPIYFSTAFGVCAWISDLCTALEVNLPKGETVKIHIDTRPQWDYNGQY